MANSGQKKKLALSEITQEVDKIMDSLKTCDDYNTDTVCQYLTTIDDFLQGYGLKQKIALSEHMAKAGFAELFPPMWNAFSRSLQDIEDRGLKKSFRIMMKVFKTSSGRSPELGVALGKSGAIKLMFESLEQVLSAQIDIKQVEVFNKVFYIFETLQNAIRFSDHNRTIYRNCNATAILTRCLKVDSKLWKLEALTVLAYVVNDSESALLASSEQSIHLLTGALKTAVTTDSHTTDIGSLSLPLYEALDAINHLAINDDNKVTVSKDDVIPAIIKILKEDGFISKERRVAAEALWNLAFIESIRNSDELQSAVPTLKELAKTEDKDLKAACESALFQIQDDKSDIGHPSTTERPPSPPPSYIEAISEPQPKPSRNRVQIMVSYQWDSQSRAIQIRDKLLEAGYQVWMDITNMRGNLLSGMADAVQKSDVILLCMTERYKDSKSCRSEAAYAYKLEKNIIPLLLEKGYQPDGWLGLLQGMELHYAFYSDQHVHSSMRELFGAIRDCIGSSADTVNGTITPTKQAVLEAAPASEPAPAPEPALPCDEPPGEPPLQHTPGKPRPAAVRDWTTQNVMDWLRDTKLGDLCACLDFCEGSHLEMLFKQYQDDGDKFKAELKSDYKINGPKCLQFTVALTKLFEAQHVGSPAVESTNSETAKSKACLIL